MTRDILFIHGGGGEAAFEEDGILVAALQKCLGGAYEVHYPKMPLEESAGFADWKAQIAEDDQGLVLGFIHLQMGKDYYYHEAHGHIADLIAAPAGEGHGIRRVLIEKVRSGHAHKAFAG
jgi:hypothetical protein